MRRAMPVFLTLLLPLGCNLGGDSYREGDTITPVYAGEAEWQGGEPAQFGARLQAQGKNNAKPRPLGFGNIPANANPVATVTFYEGDKPQSPVEVTLNDRC